MREPDGKAEPFRTVRRQSRVRSVRGRSIRGFLLGAAAEPRSERAREINQRVLVRCRGLRAAAELRARSA
jgi:hypothetical protein